MKNSKISNFILEISQVLLVFLGMYSAVMCGAMSIGLTFSRGVLALVILPTSFFMVLAVGYARRQLQTPALRLLKKSPTPIKVKRRKRAPKKEKSFLKELSSSLIWGRKSILFFVIN